MSEFHPGNSGKRTKTAEVIVLGEVAEASALLQMIAEPRPAGDYSVKSAIARAARLVSRFVNADRSLSFGRAEDIWRGEARGLRSWEMDAIRRAATAREADVRDTANVTARLRALHQAYAEADPEFYRPQMEAIERVLGDTFDRAPRLGAGRGAGTVPSQARG